MKKVFYLLVLCTLVLPAQSRDKAVFTAPKNEFREEMEKKASDYRTASKKDRKSLKVDFSKMQLPKSKDEFTALWHNSPLSQGLTGTCWSFSTTSYFESEIHRITGKQLKLSEMFTAYYEYVEKARGFVQSRGTTAFGEGSEANAVIRVWKKYGIVPEEAYNGKKPDQQVHDHEKMFTEMNDYLKSVKQMNAWSEETVVSTITSILNSYLMPPPQQFTYGGKSFTPQSFLQEEVKINLDEYVAVISLMEKPYYDMAEYEVSDNWWHSKDYYNVPLDAYMSAIKSSVRKGYTLCIFGDVSEPGIDSQNKVALIPTFDIPPEYIDESARQFRFTNGTTGDDHGIHLVGYKVKDGKDWYLIKDSGSGSFACGDRGYYFYHEDYLKLKMLGFVVHKDAVPELIQKMKH